MKSFRLTFPLIVGMSLHCSASAGEGPLPQEAQKLKADFLSTIETAEAPIRNRYVADLAKLYDQAAKEGKVNEALALKREMNDTTVQSMLGEWNDTVGRGVMNLHCNGTVSNTNGAKGRWQLQGDVLLIIWENGWKIACLVANPGEKLLGQLTDPSGGVQPFAESRPHTK